MDASVLSHYDFLIEAGNDPVLDPAPLRAHMDGWDGQAFLDAMALDADKSVLEIGVGTGRLAVRVAPHCGVFYGIDLSPKTIERAKEHLHAQKNATLLCADFLEYSFSRTFDVIYASLVFLHLKEKRQALEKVFSLLNQGGIFALSIDKNQSDVLDFGARRLYVYPDDPDKTRALLYEVGFIIAEEKDVEFAHLFFCKK